MSSSRLANKQQSHISIRSIKDPSQRKSLDELLSLLSKCLGPQSGNIVIMNESGGTVMSTSACSELLKALPIDQPIARLVTTAVSGHAANFSDGATFCGLLALTIIHLSLELDIHRHLLISVYDLLLQVSIQFLSSHKCPAKVPLDFSSTNQLLILVRSILSSKPACSLDREEINQLSRLVLIYFISGIGEKDVPKLHTIQSEGFNPIESQIYDGFLYAEPELHNDEICELSSNSSLEKGRNHIKTMLVGLSMAGDSDAFIDVKYELHGQLSKEDVVMKEVESFVELLIQLDVGILLCQKVVHQKIKDYLQSKNILVMHRLGTNGARAAASFTGGAMILSLQSPPRAADCGSVSSVQHVIIHRKSYIKMIAVDVQPGTLEICHYSSDALDEIKVVCDQAYEVLRQSLSKPFALYGGGCWLTIMASHLQNMLASHSSSWQQSLQCPRSAVLQAVRTFCNSLHKVAAAMRRDSNNYIDPQQHHHWSTPRNSDDPHTNCCCGAIKLTDKANLISFAELIHGENYMQMAKFEDSKTVQANSAEALDGFTAFSQAFQTAIATANMVLSISNVITDCN